MNRNQFLTELNQYLTFLTPAERSEVIAGYSAKFDSVCEEGEAQLILSLGTPTMIAIDLKRQKEAGKAVAPAVKDAMDNLEFESPCDEPEETAGEDAGDEPENPEEPEPEPEVEKARGRSFFKTAGAALLSLVVSVFFLAVAGIGVYFVVIMGNLLLTGLQSLSSAGNALLLFGFGLAAGAVGIAVIWLAIWSAISLIARLFRSAAYSAKA